MSQQSQSTTRQDTELNDTRQVGTEVPVHLRHRTGRNLNCVDKQGRSISEMFNCGRTGDRTQGLSQAKQACCQLSYILSMFQFLFAYSISLRSLISSLISPSFCLRISRTWVYRHRLPSPSGVMLFRHGETNGSGDNRHSQGSFLPTVSEKRFLYYYTGPYRELG